MKRMLFMVVYDLLSKEYGRGMARKMLAKKSKHKKAYLIKR